MLHYSYFTTNLKVEFCDLIFPMLIYNILANQNVECTAVLSQKFTGFLKENVTVNDSKVAIASNSSYIPSLRTIIDTVLFLRKIDKPSERFACLCMTINYLCLCVWTIAN